MHDHPKPEAKTTSEARRTLGSGRRVRGLAVVLAKEAALGNKVSFQIIMLGKRELKVKGKKADFIGDSSIVLVY